MAETRTPIPPSENADNDDVVLALETANVLWRKGEPQDSLRWLRRAAEAADIAGDDLRALALARAAADFATEIQMAAARTEERALTTELPRTFPMHGGTPPESLADSELKDEGDSEPEVTQTKSPPPSPSAKASLGPPVGLVSAFPKPPPAPKFSTTVSPPPDGSSSSPPDLGHLPGGKPTHGPGTEPIPPGNGRHTEGHSLPTPAIEKLPAGPQNRGTAKLSAAPHATLHSAAVSEPHHPPGTASTTVRPHRAGPNTHASRLPPVATPLAGPCGIRIAVARGEDGHWLVRPLNDQESAPPGFENALLVASETVASHLLKPDPGEPHRPKDA